MKEHLELGITERFGELVEKTKEGKIVVPREEAVKHKDGVIEAALKMATNRVVLARNVGELSEQLHEVANDLMNGKDHAKIDGLRAAVMMKVGEVVDSEELVNAQAHVDNLIKNGDVPGAVAWLRKMSTTKDQYKVEAKKQKEVDELLDTVIELDKTVPTDKKKIEENAGKVFDKSETLSKSIDRETNEMLVANVKIESEVARKFVENETTKITPRVPPEGKVERKKPEVDKIKKQAETAITGDKRAVEEDKKFLKRILSDSKNQGLGSVDAAGNLTIEVNKFQYIGAKLMYARASLALGRNRIELSKPENKELREYLEKMQFELRERLFDIEEVGKEKKVAKGLMPGEVEWEDLDPKLREKITDNGDFVRKYQNAEALHRLAERNGRMNVSRSEAAIMELLKERPELAANLKKSRSGEDYFWDGDAEDFFELCRQEIFKIKDVIPEERLGNLVFEDKAQLYLALMGVSSKDNPKIRQAKDAVTKTLYMEFALKSLWKAGGNHEAWQRAGGLLLREEAGTNFFLTMKMREKFRGKAGEKDIELPGFNVDDIMTMGELAAPNGQAWLAYISTDNMALNEIRLQEYVKAMAQETIKKAEFVANTPGRKQLSDIEKRSIELFKKGEINIEFDPEQMEYIRNYTHYMHTATLNAGEKLWLMDAMKPGDKGFDYASIPGGQFAEKSGLWGVLYFSKYFVTKYGYEALGKLFVPNHGLLSFARSETFRHFFSDKGNTAYKAVDGSVQNIGPGGARDFFFKNIDIGKDKMDAFTNFWQEIWLDPRTGTDIKTKGMRAIKHARDIGKGLISNGKHKEFVDKMDFDKLDELLGYKIPVEGNEAKLSWMVDNLSYEMLEVGTMPSKREGDWLNKYSKYMTETDTALQAFLDAPTLSNKMKIIESVLKYNSSAAVDMAKMLDNFMEDNRKIGFGRTEDGKFMVGPRGLRNKVNIEDLVKDPDGANMTMPTFVKPPTTGWYFGRGLMFTRQALKEGTNDPMFMRKIEIQNAIAWGLVPPEEGGKMMRDWQKMIYFGELKFNIKGKEYTFRPGYTGVLTPYFLIRGWWVDKMGLDWGDFTTIMGKQNEETFGKLMKLLGLSG